MLEVIADDCCRSSLLVGFYPQVLTEPYGLIQTTIRMEGARVDKPQTFSKKPDETLEAGRNHRASVCVVLNNPTNRSRSCFSLNVFYCTIVFTGVIPCDPGPHLRMRSALCSDKRNEQYYGSAKSGPKPFERTWSTAASSTWRSRSAS
jgi:hypothetical protein